MDQSWRQPPAADVLESVGVSNMATPSQQQGDIEAALAEAEQLVREKKEQEPVLQAVQGQREQAQVLQQQEVAAKERKQPLKVNPGDGLVNVGEGGDLSFSGVCCARLCSN